jgi:hypothetical protein
VICNGKWNEDGLPIFEAVVKPATWFKGKPAPTGFASAGLLFGPGEMLRRVPYDPNLPHLFRVKSFCIPSGCGPVGTICSHRPETSSFTTTSERRSQSTGRICPRRTMLGASKASSASSGSPVYRIRSFLRERIRSAWERGARCGSIGTLWVWTRAIRSLGDASRFCR